MTGSVRESNGRGRLDKRTQRKDKGLTCVHGVDFLQTERGSYTWNREAPLTSPFGYQITRDILSSPLIACNTSFLPVNSTYGQDFQTMRNTFKKQEKYGIQSQGYTFYKQEIYGLQSQRNTFYKLEKYGLQNQRNTCFRIRLLGIYSPPP